MDTKSSYEIQYEAPSESSRFQSVIKISELKMNFHEEFMFEL